MNPDLLSLLITEVFPNPETGNEWVELYCPDENQDVGNFTNFTLSDEKKIIYTFDGQEVWENQLSIIEISGLNNDGDSIILKNSEDLIIDQMSYNSSKKEQSWSRINLETQEYILGVATPGQLNFNNILTPIPTITSTPAIELTPTPISNPTAAPTPTETSKKTNISNNSNKSKDFDGKTYFANYFQQEIKLECQKKTIENKNSRLVLLGQKTITRPVIDAIMGSSLLLLAAFLLSYEQKKDN